MLGDISSNLKLFSTANSLKLQQPQVNRRKSPVYQQRERSQHSNEGG